MKVKVSEKQIKSNYDNIICVGYCSLNYLLSDKEPNFFTSGIYGWNADIYQIDYNTCLVMGYRPFGNIYASYEGKCKKYEEKARKIYNETENYQDAMKKISKLFDKFVNECLQNKEQ